MSARLKVRWCGQRNRGQLECMKTIQSIPYMLQNSKIRAGGGTLKITTAYMALEHKELAEVKAVLKEILHNLKIFCRWQKRRNRWKAPHSNGHVAAATSSVVKL